MKEKLCEAFADALFPQSNACHLCGAFPDRESLLCSRCMKGLESLRYGKLRTAAQEPHPPLRACLAAYPHKHEARDLIHLLKYESDTVLAGLLGESMANALVSSPAQLQADAVVPVPLHPSRLEQRGYNQARLLSEALCFHTGLTLLDGALIRLHATDTQLRRERAARLKAMEHAFAVIRPDAVRGKHLLLVDDVLTTGATAMSCASALLSAGAASVSLLTACRA